MFAYIHIKWIVCILRNSCVFKWCHVEQLAILLPKVLVQPIEGPTPWLLSLSRFKCEIIFRMLHMFSNRCVYTILVSHFDVHSALHIHPQHSNMLTSLPFRPNTLFMKLVASNELSSLHFTSFHWENLHFVWTKTKSNERTSERANEWMNWMRKEKN